MTWTDLIEYGPGWAACILIPLSWHCQRKWAAEDQAPKTRHTDTPHVDPADRCRAEYHQPNWPSGHCDRPAGHPDNHRDQTISAYYQWRDDHAVYPTEPTTED